MYTPTKQELEEMWFNHEYDDYHEELQAWHTECEIDIVIKDDWEVTIRIDQNDDLEVFPQSREDVETLIRLFKQP